MIPKSIRLSLLLILAMISSLMVEGQGFIATRMNNKQPIITRQMFLDLGATAEEAQNINGPSLIRIPDWIPLEERADSSAVFYLYFANHRGNYLRLAWSAEIEGPYHLYKVGSEYEVGNRGIIDLGADDKISVRENLTLQKHMASPDVIVDDSNKQIIMYFHGPVDEPDGQRTFVATSPYGLNFQDSILPVLIGTSYARIFEYKDTVYGIMSKAGFAKGGHVDDPWNIPPDHDFLTKLWDHRSGNPYDDYYETINFDGRVRHPGIHLEEDTLFVFYSRVGDTPERIQMSAIRLDIGTYDTWQPIFPHMEILRTEEVWEGVELPIMPSESGSVHEMMHQLRDPDIFEDIDGSLYLLYSGAAENALGIARLERTYGNPVHTENLKAAAISPELDVIGDHATGKLLFSIQSEANSGYELRIFGLDGRLYEIVRGRSSSDGTAQAEWVPQSNIQGIYIANLITNNHSVSVKFHY